MTMRPLVLALAASSLLLTAADRPRPKPMEAPPPAASQLEPAPDAVKLVRSCQVDSRSCVEWEGAFAGVDLKARCRKLKGTWSEGACPTGQRIGTCTQRETSSDDRSVTRSYAPMKPEDARAACQKQPRAVFMNR
jgi:hypothetical protein